jgi:putative adenylate-forming enzyme
MRLFNLIKIYYFIIKWYVITKYFRNFRTTEILMKWQKSKIQQIVNYAFSHSKFYQKQYANYSLVAHQKLPLIEKNNFMANFDDINTVGITLNTAYQIAAQAEQSRDFSQKEKDITVGLSSGTSGNRGVFLVSAEERYAWVGAVLAKMLPGSIFQKNSIAFFLRANSKLYTSLRSSRIKFNFFDLLDDLDAHIKNLNNLCPTILVAPASMLKILAQKLINGKLNINPVRVISVAEILEPFDKSFIESAFKQKIHQIYQATEGFIAATCKEGVLHLNEDLLYIEKEYIDQKKNKFIPIITDLFRKSQPVIRYRLNDIITLKNEPCKCGSVFTAIEQIDGRSDDLLYFREHISKNLKPFFPDFIRRAIITSSEYIEEYAVEQSSPETLYVMLKLKAEKNDVLPYEINIKNKIESLLKNLNFEIPKILFKTYSPPEKGTKLRRIKRLYKVGTV